MTSSKSDSDATRPAEPSTTLGSADESDVGAPAGSPLSEVMAELTALDTGIYAVVAATPTPRLDTLFRGVSRMADNSRIWFAVAGLLALVGGHRGRRAAASGVASIGVASAVVNLGLKPVARRRRPDRDQFEVPIARQVPMPRSTSFPSGHSASAFAFANAVGDSMPHLSFPLQLAANAVAWSRVHTGVHYPGDVLAGALIGSTTGEVVSAVGQARSARRSR